MQPTFRQITTAGPGFSVLIAVLGVLLAGGAWAFYNMEHFGHIVTGMNNQIVWGLPHVFAVFLIVAASGALNVASIGSVFGKIEYKYKEQKPDGSLGGEVVGGWDVTTNKKV